MCAAACAWPKPWRRGHGIFPEIYRALIAAGEESGDLAQVMERLADYIEERNNLRGKILTAFIYPGVVGLVSVAIVIFPPQLCRAAGGQRVLPGPARPARADRGDAHRQ
nr:hypothetical protein GCM10020185_70340 [Pseudomonas brassicacearum subsp. brassicacearum]